MLTLLKKYGYVCFIIIVALIGVILGIHGAFYGPEPQRIQDQTIQLQETVTFDYHPNSSWVIVDGPGKSYVLASQDRKTHILFTSSGTYFVVIGSNDTARKVQYCRVVVVGNDQPLPDNPDKPDQPDQPDVPVESQLAMAIATHIKSDISVENRNPYCSQIAENFRQVAKGAPSTLEEGMEQVAKLNRTTLGFDSDNRRPQFEAEWHRLLRDTLDELIEQNYPKGNFTCQSLFIEISKGFSMMEENK